MRFKRVNKWLYEVEFKFMRLNLYRVRRDEFDKWTVERNMGEFDWRRFPFELDSKEAAMNMVVRLLEEEGLVNIGRVKKGGLIRGLEIPGGKTGGWDTPGYPSEEF